ncbi:hypothetical protein B296_00052475, partial [Ensete ventricosum]
LAKVKSMHQVDAFWNSSRMYRKLVEGIWSLPGWRKGVRQRRSRLTGRLSGVAEKLTESLTVAGSMKLQPDDEPRYSLGIGSSSDDAVGFRWKFARRFTKEIGKLTGNTKGDRREEDQRTCRKIIGGYRSMREAGQRKSQAGIRKVEGTTFAKISVDAKDVMPKHDSTHHCHPRLEEKAPGLTSTIEPSHYDGSTFPLWWSNQTATMDPHSHYGGQAYPLWWIYTPATVVEPSRYGGSTFLLR